MKRSQNIVVYLCLILALALVLSEQSPCSASGPEKGAAAEAVNAFGLDLYRQIRKPDGNLIFSPYSISACLAMAYAGARGNTESQMAKALHFDLEQPKVSEAFRALNAQVLAAGQGKAAELNIANALWAEKSFTFKKEFLEAIRNNFAQESGWFSASGVFGFIGMAGQEGLRQLDFRHSPESARQTINTWVEKQTNDKIKGLIPQGMITGDTRLVLTNAMYFKGKWESQFEKKLTRQDPFILLDGKEIKVPMMRRTHSFGYAEETDLQVLEMPYRGGELSMVVLLPPKQRRLEDFEQSLTQDKVDHWLKGLETRKVEVYVPKFKMTTEFQLKKNLTRLGMIDAFSLASADFSGMTGNKDLFIGEAVHKAFVDTNEEGTEAAAATAVTMRTGMASTKPNPIPVFRADHPFLFLIRHKPSNCILFFGRVTKP
jgi:serpin B